MRHWVQSQHWENKTTDRDASIAPRRGCRLSQSAEGPEKQQHEGANEEGGRTDVCIDACSRQLHRSCWPLHEGITSALTNFQHTGVIQSLRKGKNSEAPKLQTLLDDQFGHLVNPVPSGKAQFLQVPERTQSLGCGRHKTATLRSCPMVSSL